MLDHIKTLGCSNQALVMMAHQTYLELTLVEKCSDVSCYHNKKLDILYLEGKKNDIISTYVPIHSSFKITLTWIQDVQNELSNTHPKSIILVIRETDSSSVRYKLSQDLILPALESNRRLKLNREGASSSKTRKRKLSDDSNKNQL